MSLVPEKINEDERLMRGAYNLALQAYEDEEVPVGAIITYKNQIIAKAHNQTERLSDCTAHAEMIALTSAMNYTGGKYLRQCTMYVTLEPCVMCAGALFWAQLGKLVFAASDEKRGYQRHQPSLLHPVTTVLSGVMAEDCSLLLKQFFKKIRGEEDSRI